MSTFRLIVLVCVAQTLAQIGAFSVPALEPVIAWLQSAGVDVEAIRTHEYTGQRFTFFQDPDGLPLELYETG